MDLSKVDNIEFGPIDHNDYPDYADAEIMSADYNGKEMSESQLNHINEQTEFVHEKLFEYLY